MTTNTKTKRNKNLKCKYYTKNIEVVSKSGDLFVKRFVLKHFHSKHRNSRERKKKIVSVKCSMFFHVPQVQRIICSSSYLCTFLGTNTNSLLNALHFANQIFLFVFFFLVISFAIRAYMDVFKYQHVEKSAMRAV